MNRPKSRSDHRALYKSTGPSWKNTYRQRCHDRLKKRREQVLGRLREESSADSKDTSMVEDVMRDEWANMQNEDPTLTEGPYITERGSQAVDDYLSIIEEIRAELIYEEQKILSEYEAGVAFDEAALCATINNLSTTIVICPVCSRNPLLQNKGVVFCSCGVRIDTEQDCISLDSVRENLEFGSSQHSAVCQDAPIFSVVNHTGFNNLLMMCQVCDFMYVVV